MNASYQPDSPDPHVHLHFRPRFANPVNFKGFTFQDVDFGRHYDSQRTARLPETTENDLVSMLRANLQTGQSNTE